MADVQDNPYCDILGTLRADTDERGRPAWCLGRVLRRAPLAVEISGVSVSGACLKASARLLEGDTLRPGDEVVLLADPEWQTFVAICKVVSAG